MPQIDVWLDSEDIDAAQSAGSFNFDIPADAAVKGNINDLLDNKAKATWMQTLDIIECKQYADETYPTQKDPVKYPCVTFELKFQVPSNALRNGEPDPNSGKSHTAWYRIVPAAQKNKNHPKYKANNFAIGTLNGILRSIWGTDVIPHGSSVNLGDFYGGEPVAAVVGKPVVATVTASRYDGKRKDELRDFVPLELQS